MANFDEYSALSQVAIRSAANAFVSDAKLEQEWRPLRFHNKPQIEQALVEYADFRQLLVSTGAQLIDLESADNLTIDSIYTRDSILISPNGLILCNMGRASRTPEAKANAAAYLSRFYRTRL